MPNTNETNHAPLTTKATMESVKDNPLPPMNGEVNNSPIAENCSASVGPTTNTGINMKSVVNATNKKADTDASTINAVLRLLFIDKNLLI